MPWLISNIHRLMILCGSLTLTMVYAVIAPGAARRSTFGESWHGGVADIVVRTWVRSHGTRLLGYQASITVVVDRLAKPPGSMRARVSWFSSTWATYRPTLVG